jgi:hypothetical protein
MLNPSTADDLADDPTIRRVVGFSRSWGFGLVSVVNLHSHRATDPAKLSTLADYTVDEANDAEILREATPSRVIVAAWGAHATRWPRRVEHVRRLLGDEVYCLGLTKHGHPKHPLYVHGSAVLVPFDMWVPLGKEGGAR